jgi:hypothetical protein
MHPYTQLLGVVPQQEMPPQSAEAVVWQSALCTYVPVNGSVGTPEPDPLG